MRPWPHQHDSNKGVTRRVSRPVLVSRVCAKEIKAFYMRLNDDGKTVAAMDVLVPKVSRRRMVTRSAETRQGLRHVLLHRHVPAVACQGTWRVAVLYLSSHCVCLTRGRPCVCVARLGRWASSSAARNVRTGWTCWSGALG
jgi:hypothetical protein